MRRLWSVLLSHNAVLEVQKRSWELLMARLDQGCLKLSFAGVFPRVCCSSIPRKPGLRFASVGGGWSWCAPAAVWIKNQRERPRHPEKSRNVGKGPQGQRILVGAGLDRSCCSALTHPWKPPALSSCKILPGRTPCQLESGPVSQSVVNWY